MINRLSHSSVMPPSTAALKQTDAPEFAEWLKPFVPALPPGQPGKVATLDDGDGSLQEALVATGLAVPPNQTSLLMLGFSDTTTKCDSLHGRSNVPNVPNGLVTGLDSTAGSTDNQVIEPVVIEFHLSSDRGNVEILSVPWRLVPSGRLSLLDTTELSLKSIAFEASTVAEDGRGYVDTDQAPGRPTVIANHKTTISRARVEAGQLEVAIADEFEELTHSIGAHPSQSTDSGIWLQRVIRWVEQQGHPATVWIRDYGLDEASTRQVEEGVRMFAKKHSARLERIVINAHEVWRRPQVSSQEIA